LQARTLRRLLVGNLMQPDFRAPPNRQPISDAN
jgi:hypothetical protein